MIAKKVLLAALLWCVASLSFAATIGNDVRFASGYTGSSSDAHYLSYATSESRVAVVGENVTAVGFWFVGNFPSGEQVEVGVYRKDTLAEIGSATVSRVIGGGDERAIASVSWALTPGIEYIVAFRFINTVNTAREFVASGHAKLSAATGATPLADPFVISTSTGNRYGVFAITDAASGTVCNPISGRCGPAAAPITR